ncbi:MAG: thioredoxin domain-containing protein [Candidatus Omnitrophota bacterium]
MIKQIEINDTQFNALVLKASLPVLLECASPECIICKTMAERIIEAGKEYKEQMLFLRLNVNDNRRWQDYGVRVIPTLLYFKDGELLARQENFPEIEEIHAQIKTMVAGQQKSSDLKDEFKSAIDLERSAALFYKYVFTNAKNGRMKERFRSMHHQAVSHAEVLEKKYREMTGESYAAAKGPVSGLEPQRFSLLGALKASIRLEKMLLVFYKKLAKKKLRAPDKELFKQMARQENAHLKAVEKEKRFSQRKEMESSMELSEQSVWLQKFSE